MAISDDTHKGAYMTQPVAPHILLATDFSQGARGAQEYAIYLGARLSAQVTVLHVVECPRWLESYPEVASFLDKFEIQVDRQLEDIRKSCAAEGLKAAVRRVRGLPNMHIDVVAAEVGAELVVLGAQGGSGFEDKLLGSVAERVTKTAPCPVLTVPLIRGGDGSRPTSHAPVAIRRILAPVDFSAPSLESVEYAILLAQGLDAKLTLLHVVEPAYHDSGTGPEQVRDAGRRPLGGEHRLMELVSLIKSFGLPGDAMIRGGIPADSILACAQEQGSDLIVMGTHGRRGFSRLRFGSVAEMVLRLTTCPVLTVKSPTFAPDHRRVVPKSMAEG
jgi:nucleotide-binding universal stress UspA family protein